MLNKAFNLGRQHKDNRMKVSAEFNQTITFGSLLVSGFPSITSISSLSSC